MLFPLNVWSIVNTTLFEHDEEHITYALILMRKPTVYVTDIIIPCSLITLLSGFALFIKAGNDSRLEVQLTVIVAISVYQLLASQNLPTSDELPILTRYLIIQVTLIYMSIVVTLILWGVRHQIDTRPLNFRPKFWTFRIIVEWTLGLVTLARFNELYYAREKMQDKLWKLAQEKLKNRVHFKTSTKNGQRGKPGRVSSMRKSMIITDYLTELSENPRHHAHHARHTVTRAHQPVTLPDLQDFQSRPKQISNTSSSSESSESFTEKSPESKLARIEWDLVFLSLDRMFAFAYIFTLVGFFIWVLNYSDVDEQVDEIFEEIESLKRGESKIFESLIDGAEIH